MYNNSAGSYQLDNDLSLRPPLLVVNDELWQMLNEALALADTSDENIAPAVQRGLPQRHTRDRNKVMNVMPEAFDIRDSPRGAFRRAASYSPRVCHLHAVWCRMLRSYIRVIAVYFESLYWTVNEVKDAASDGLQTALSHQARMPRIYYTAA
jgi:transformation/transcription domain-associated protein